jgi:branched-chain amino acid aminotransferase group II
MRQMFTKAGGENLTEYNINTEISRPQMNLRETNIAIKFIKDNFEKVLAKEMNLTRVSAPLFVRPETGLNDTLSGTERPVSFDIKNGSFVVEIVHSLAKWKRMALKRYGFDFGEGLYTDMNAIRRDEVLDNLHSVYVDQWDWEVVIHKDQRNVETLKSIEAIKTLVRLEKDWVPKAPGTSLYIRPFIIATDPFLGVHPSHTYKFLIILAPSGAYYPGGINPVKIYVEDKYVRAAQGGTGYAKTMANYAISLKAQEEAEKKGYVQVLWLDGIKRKYVEEVGAMNVFFKVNGEVITPALNGTILPGITRDSVIAMLKHMNIPVSERLITIDELVHAAEEGTMEEAFGTGTAAVISPIGELNYKDKIYTINNGSIGPISQKLYDSLTGIQYRKIEDPFGWVVPVE